MTRLRNAMIGNAVFSSGSAVAFLVFRQGIAVNTSIPTLALEVIAVGLLGFAALLLYGAFNARIQMIGRWAVLLDWAWVAGSLPALLLPLTELGRIGIVTVAVLVAGFAVWQQRGLSISRSR
jgi:hypothetical protein